MSRASSPRTGRPSTCPPPETLEKTVSVWFITGSSRGFGLEITRAALAAGHQVVATARKAKAAREQLPDAGDALLAVPLDVTDPESIQAAVDAAAERFGRIDVLVNNAGTGLLAAIEESDDAAVRAVYETNVFGPLAVQRAVLPILRRQRSGHVINISSIVGFATAPGWGIYASTKFAVEGFTGFLRVCPGLRAGEESGSCGAGQGQPDRRQGDPASTPHGGDVAHSDRELSTVSRLR
ncbi:SDR family NAD(P)-dependent oxidoreductase [Streptomyces sp. NPDC003996]